MDKVSELQRKLSVIRAYVLGTLTVAIMLAGGCAFSKITELNKRLDKIEPLGNQLVEQLTAFNHTFERAVDLLEGNEADPGKIDEVLEEARKLRHTITDSEDTLREFLGMPPKEREEDEDE